MKNFIIAAIAFILIASLTVIKRHWITIQLISTGKPPPLLDVTEEGDDVSWHDDYYIVQVLDQDTFAIGEPRYQQQNFNYLIAGTERAILFDAGSGFRNILPVAESLTDRPITFIPSHLHYDHIGNGVSFDHVALIDLPHLRARTKEEKLQLTWQEHLGSAEGYDTPRLPIHQWIQPNDVIDLGGRELLVLYTPGHTDDSISLADQAAGLIFSGDFIYPGPLFGFLPNSNLGDYLQGAETLLTVTRSDSRIFGAHRLGPPGAPVQALTDLHDLRKALFAIHSGDMPGEGIYPITYVINPTLQLLAEPGWLQNWDPIYPELQPN